MVESLRELTGRRTCLLSLGSGSRQSSAPELDLLREGLLSLTPLLGSLRAKRRHSRGRRQSLAPIAPVALDVLARPAVPLGLRERDSLGHLCALAVGVQVEGQVARDDEAVQQALGQTDGIATQA